MHLTPLLSEKRSIIVCGVGKHVFNVTNLAKKTQSIRTDKVQQSNYVQGKLLQTNKVKSIAKKTKISLLGWKKETKHKTTQTHT